MRIAVEFLPDAHRWGPDAPLNLARQIEQLGYDQIDLFDHITAGLPTVTRTMPDSLETDILEPLVTLGAMASVTSRVGLGTGILVLPQRQPALVAKQVSTLDLLSGGRVRLGVGVGWQEAEYDSLGVPFRERGRRMDESIALLRHYWTEPSVSFDGAFYHAEAMGMDPKPEQPGGPPIWIGGDSDAALKRAGRLGDGWMAMMSSDETVANAPDNIATIRAAAEEAGRDPDVIGLQTRISDPASIDALGARIEAIRQAGFTWASVNMSMLEAAGADSVDAQVDMLGRIRDRIQGEVGALATR